MSQKSQQKPAGNTKTAGLNNQLYRYCVTLKREDITPSQLSQHLKGFCKKFTFQIEKGESGYEHYQIEVSLKEKLYFHQFKNILGFNDAHIEPTRDYLAAIKYCSKADTRIEGPWDEKSVFLKTLTVLRPWQKSLETELLTEPDDRKIIWIYDNGNTGKSSFAKYMAITHNATVLGNGKLGDLSYAIPDNPKIIIFNLTRSVDGYVNYAAIECIKDGLVFSSKYESKTKIYNCPHIVIFANFEPDESKLTGDRWDIRNLD